MAAPAVPFYGKDTDRLARLGIAYKALAESGSFLDNWPSTVANLAMFKQRNDLYQSAYDVAIHGDRRYIAQRTAACNDAGATWQKIVNYACATEQDNTELLQLMGVTTTPRRNSSVNTRTELHAPELSVVNLDETGVVRASCPYERRSYTYDIWVTEGDPRVEDGWYHKASYGDCTKMDMPGYQSGKQYSFRCRVIGKDNSVGPWSLTVTMMVT
jgi:hypothetical protein